MKNLLLKSFLSEFQTVHKINVVNDDITITGVSIDSRTINSGELFIAIRGDRFDGHKFVESAINSSAAAVVVDEKGKENLPEFIDNLIVVEDTLKFLMEFGSKYRSLFNFPVIGLTGSAGKTTTKEMMAEVLKTNFNVVKTAKNQNNFIGVPLTLLKFDSDTEIGIVELGTNHPGEISELTNVVRPTHAAITNIGSGHIGFFGSREAIYQEKIGIFNGLENNATIYINQEDEHLRKFSCNSVRIKRFGFEDSLEYRALVEGKDDLGRIKFRVNDGPLIQLDTPGSHQVLNALLAAAIGLDLGVSPHNVKIGLENYKSTAQRMEWFYQDDVLFINDAYNSNPESLKAAINYLCELPGKSGRERFLIIGDMLELGDQSESQHLKIGEFIESRKIDYVYCFGEKSRIIAECLSDSQSFSGEAKWFRQHKDIATQIQNKLKGGDVVLIKGSRGMTMENVLTHLEIRR